TGQHSANHEGGFAVGVFRSRDGGSTWSLIGAPDMAGLPISSIVSQRIGTQDVVLVGAEAQTVLERSVIKMTGNPTLTFADGNPDTITRSAGSGSWVDEGFAPGQLIEVTGTTRNDARFTVAAVTDTVLTLEASDILAPEAGVMNAKVVSI